MNTTETIYQNNLEHFQRLITNASNDRFAIDRFHSARHLLVTEERELFYQTLLEWNLSEKEVPDDEEWENMKFQWKSVIISSSFQQDVHSRTLLSVAKIFCILRTIGEIEPENFREGARFLTDKIFILFQEESLLYDESYSIHVKRALKFIHRSLQDPELRLKLIAEQLHLSSPYLSTLFHEETGESITSYIHKMKIDASLKKLLHTTASVREIAEESGYSSTTTYCRKFKEIKKQSPLQYRKTYTRY